MSHNAVEARYLLQRAESHLKDAGEALRRAARETAPTLADAIRWNLADVEAAETKCRRFLEHLRPYLPRE